MRPSEQEPVAYAVRIAGRVRDTLLHERERRAVIAGPERAADWYDDVLTAVRSLATYPERCATAPENDLLPGATVRQLLHPRGRGPAWRLLFTVHQADANDPPTVRIHCARHSAQPPLTEWLSENNE